MAGSLTEIHQRYRCLLADCRMRGDCTYSASNIARDYKKRGLWASTGTGAGILLAGFARESCMAGYSAPEVTVHTHNIATVSVADSGQTWEYHRQHRS